MQQIEHLLVLEFVDYLSHLIDFCEFFPSFVKLEILLPHTSDACYKDQVRLQKHFLCYYQHFKIRFIFSIL